MKKFIILKLAFIISISISCSKQNLLNNEYAMITFLIGVVTKNGVAVEMGELIKENDIIKTSAGAFCDIKIGSSVIRIKQKSKVIISQLVNKKNLESTNVGIVLGKILCKPKKLLKTEKFLIKTPTAIAGVRGTEFSVEIDKRHTTRIKVYDGKVKVAKRIEQLDNNADMLLNASNSLKKNEKTIITKNEVDKAEKLFRKLYAQKAGKFTDKKKLISEIIKKSNSKFTVSRNQIQKFTASELVNDKKEMIEVKVRSGDIVKKIADVIKKQKEVPEPEGILLVTRYEIYFIKDGKVVWEGVILNLPINRNGKLYVASGEYIFCADPDGPILWKQKIKNDGLIEFKGKNLTVKSNGKKLTFDPVTGEKL